MAAQLRGNMRDVFKCNPEGQGFAAHHIVPHSMQGQDWDRARQVLANANIHLNEAANGVFLPHFPRTAEAYPSLGKIHNFEFHADAMAKKVADRLEAAAPGGKTAVQDELQRIANDIADGNLP